MFYGLRATFGNGQRWNCKFLNAFFFLENRIKNLVTSRFLLEAPDDRAGAFPVNPMHSITHSQSLDFSFDYSLLMEAYRQGYYAQNCHPESFTWFDGWEYPAYISHAISLFLIPLNVYGGYCILCKTPKKMEGAKLIMFNLHFWNSYLDVLISSMITPYLFLPVMCGFSVGIFNWLGVHALVQVFFGQTALAGE